MKKDFTLEELNNLLLLKCSKHNLSYSLHQQPIKVGPDCYLFYATELTKQCRKEGKCKYESYYALTGGGDITILDKNHTALC